MDFVKEAGRKLKHALHIDSKRVYDFEEGSEDKKLFGMKGSALCELSNMKLPVPPGFIITSDNFLEYLDHGEGLSDKLKADYRLHIRRLENKTGRVFGGAASDGKSLPLLLSVRATASIIVPGIMDTILNVGMNDSVVSYLVSLNQGYIKFALDLHRRFLYMFGVLVLRNSTVKYERVMDTAMEMDNADTVAQLSCQSLTYVVGEFKRFTAAPNDPYEQLDMVIEAMYQHSLSPRVSEYLDSYATSIPQIPRSLAVIVQMMVYGNLNSNSGCGVAFSRPLSQDNDADGRPVGEFLAKAEGKEVLEGDRNATPIEDFSCTMPKSYSDLEKHMSVLEEKHKAVEYVEFTVEDGVLYVLETSAVNLQPNKKEARFVVYYDLLRKLQEEEENEECKELLNS